MKNSCIQMLYYFLIVVFLMAGTFSVRADEISNQYELFIEGLVGYMSYGPFNDRSFKPEFTYNELPPKLKHVVSLPAQSKIVGSLINGDNIDMVFVSKLSPEKIKQTLEENITSAGWSIPTPIKPNFGGFQAYSDSNLLDALFCDKDESTFIRLFIRPKADSNNIVLLKYIEGRERSPCKQSGQGCPCRCVQLLSQTWSILKTSRRPWVILPAVEIRGTPL